MGQNMRRIINLFVLIEIILSAYIIVATYGLVDDSYFTFAFMILVLVFILNLFFIAMKDRKNNAPHASENERPPWAD